ncbi:MAG: hypothetical protein JXP34_26740 [Planctomycetes bacterium]|nr:hypothetical protein [Planctomycetota bacterium]
MTPRTCPLCGSRDITVRQLDDGLLEIACHGCHFEGDGDFVRTAPTSVSETPPPAPGETAEQKPT